MLLTSSTINPANIIWNQATNQLKIIDFGISTQLSKQHLALKNPAVLEGTLAYMSPEQTGRMNRALDYRTDFYSLGATFYELFTGKVPFESKDAMELVHCHIAKMPTPVCEVNPDVPPIISDIVMKLMAKNAEDRYQSAFGVKFDLEKCLENLTGLQDLSGLSFELAQNDFSGKLQIPQKLYGREHEINTLLQAFERVSSGKAEMMLVAGYSGVGKTALVREVHKPMTEKHGYFSSGKFDQFQKNIPYFAISQAFNQFCRYLLMESAETLANWQNQILEAVGNNGQIIIDVIPDLELVIGPKPAVEKVGPIETQNRFQLFFLNFVKALCKQEHPFILFIDDLQWVDSASLGLLKSIMLDDEIRYLLIIGAYRDNEVDNTHPFVMAIDELQKANAIINTIFLANLQQKDVNHLLQESLLAEMKKTQSLTDLIYQKTQGNAFFTHQFLQTLYEEDLLHFDFLQFKWLWEAEKIAAQNITDNVVELMANKINKLSDNTSKVLQLAACIGNQFDLSILAIIYEQDKNETLEVLTTALAEELIQPLDENYKHLETTFQSQFKFLHDRVQQAAYALIDDEPKQTVHLQIGRLLLTNTPADTLEEKVFDIVSQFNKALTLITQTEEKRKIAELNLTACEKAKESNAYIPAYEYLQNAIYLINEKAWQNHYDLTLTINIALSQVAFLTADFKQMEQYIEIVLKNATNTLDKLQAYEVRMQYLIALSKQAEALQLGLDMLSLLDESLSTELLANIDIESLINLPIMHDPVKLSAMRILNLIVTPA